MGRIVRNVTFNGGNNESSHAVSACPSWIEYKERCSEVEQGEKLLLFMGMLDF